VGCLLFGAVVGLAEGRVLLGVGARTFLLVGVLGGFTTFSSFSYESLQLARDGQFALAAVNGLGQLAVGFLAVWAGFSLVRGL
jgi:CrcB protein